MLSCELGIAFARLNDFGDWTSTWVDIPSTTPDKDIEEVAVKKYMNKVSDNGIDVEIDKVWLRHYQEKE